jgi:hypothetical protein
LNLSTSGKPKEKTEISRRKGAMKGMTAMAPMKYVSLIFPHCLHGTYLGQWKLANGRQPELPLMFSLSLAAFGTHLPCGRTRVDLLEICDLPDRYMVALTVRRESNALMGPHVCNNEVPCPFWFCLRSKTTAYLPQAPSSPKSNRRVRAKKEKGERAFVTSLDDS